MLKMDIILILLYCLSLSFQTIQSGLVCDDTMKDIYVYDAKLGNYRLLKHIYNPADCYGVDYVDLDVDPGDFIKFTCYNKNGPTLGGGCFLINNICRCYDFNVNGRGINKEKDPWHFEVEFGNSRICNYYAKYRQPEDEATLVYYYNVPLDVDGITCLKKTITAPINAKRSLNFSEFIYSSFKVTNLNIGIMTNYNYFTFNNLPISEYDQFKILSDELKYFSNKTTKINIQFKNYGIVIEKDKICELNIRFCYNSCLECYDIEPNETSHQCSECKDDFYFVENTNNCMKKDQMNNSNYYFDYNKKIFRQCLNECSTCDNETYCTNCTEDYHFIYNETGKCISKPNDGDLLYLDNTTNTYRKCPEEAIRVENNECILGKEDKEDKEDKKDKEDKEDKKDIEDKEDKSNNIIIIILVIVILIIIIALFFFIKRKSSKKNFKTEISNTFENNSADNKLLNVFL